MESRGEQEVGEKILADIVSHGGAEAFEEGVMAPEVFSIEWGGARFLRNGSIGAGRDQGQRGQGFRQKEIPLFGDGRGCERRGGGNCGVRDKGGARGVLRSDALRYEKHQPTTITPASVFGYHLFARYHARGPVPRFLAGPCFTRSFLRRPAPLKSPHQAIDDLSANKAR